MAETDFRIGDRIVHLGELWYYDYQHRTGTVIDVNPCGRSHYGNRGDMRSKVATKLKVRWDWTPRDRVQQTATSWVLSDLCRPVPTATSDEPFAIRDGEAMTLWDLPESRAIVAAVGALESISTDLLVAIEPFRVPEPPPTIDGMRADDV